MEANFKVEEASYFLEKLKRLVKNSAKYGNIEEIDKEFMFNLSAFLSAWRSILDVLLYDYAEKYLGVNREEKLDTHTFKIAAIARENQEAIKFIDWYNKQLGILKQNPLWKKRTVSVHRSRPKMSREYKLYLTETIALTGSLSSSIVSPEEMEKIASLEKMDNKSNVISTGDQIIKFTYFFDEIKDKEAPLICEEALKRMKEIIEDALKNFSF